MRRKAGKHAKLRVICAAHTGWAAPAWSMCGQTYETNCTSAAGCRSRDHPDGWLSQSASELTPWNVPNAMTRQMSNRKGVFEQNVFAAKQGKACAMEESASLPRHGHCMTRMQPL